MIDNEMKEAAEMLRTEFSEGTVMVDVRVLSEMIKAMAAVHKMGIDSGRIREDDPRIIGQAQMGIAILKMFQAIVAKHADEIAAAKFKHVELDKVVKLFEDLDNDELTGDDK